MIITSILMDSDPKCILFAYHWFSVKLGQKSVAPPGLEPGSTV